MTTLGTTPVTTPQWPHAGPPTPLRVALSIASGVTLALAFPGWGWSWLAPVGVALATVAWWRAPWRQAMWVGYIGGVAFHAMLLVWIRVLGWDAWVVLSLFWSLWWLLLAPGVALVTWLRWWPLAVPGVWILVEALRARLPWGGFPWGKIAFAQSDSVFTPWAAIGGAPLVSALVALAGTVGLWGIFSLRNAKPRGALAAAAAVVTISLSGLLIPLPTAGQGNPSSETLAVVQGSVPRTGLDFNAQRRAVLNNHIGVTEELAASIAAGEEATPAAVIWPENASDVDPYRDAQAAAAISEVVDLIGVPVLVGAVVAASPTTLHNIGIVWEPGEGPTDTYIKQHPVPFGEYLPGRSLVTSLVSRFERIPKDFQPGDTSGVLQLGPVRIGDVICFEIAYDTLVRDTVRDGAQVLVVQTNNATYGGTSQLAQQVAMSQLRAVEHGRSVLIAATSGITAVIDPAGNVVAELPEFVPGWLVESVPLRDSLTVADRVGWWPELAWSVLGLSAWIIAVGQRRSGRGVPSSNVHDERLQSHS